MRARLDRNIASLKIFHAVIGLLFALVTVLYCISESSNLIDYFYHFSDSFWNILGAIIPIFTGAMAAAYLIPMLLGLIMQKYSAQIFEFQVFFSRAFMYFPLAPGIIILAVYLCYIVFLAPNELGPASFDLIGLSHYAFVILLYIIAALMAVAYKIAHKLG